MFPRFLLIGLFVLAEVLSSGAGEKFAISSERPPLLYTVATTYEPLAWMRGVNRFSSDVRIFIRDQKGQRPLVAGFAASADPSVSFDGQRVLFAGKLHPQDRWQIWQLGIDGEAPRRITSSPDDCVRPLYLPDDRIVYARKADEHFVLEVADLGGGKPLALTYAGTSAFPSDVLRDGRILFEAGFPLGAASNPEIYAVYSDGSGVESYRCDHGPARHSAWQTRSGDIVFASARGLSKFTSARAREVALAAPAGEYAGGSADAGVEDWLLSWRPHSNAHFQLVRWAPGSSSVKPLEAEPNANVIEPAVLAPRAIPNRHPSGLHDWDNANLLCLNAYTSEFQFTPLTIHSVRMYTRGPDGKAKLLGMAPVERDGSFFVQVPTEKPIQIELLDETGKTLKREAGFFWMRRGEQRGCVGCHAGPQNAPENAVPLILLKSTEPAHMTGDPALNASGGH